ncbi:MAG: coproporphyrinogen dehydrogenase HemZ [Bacillota bacterium]|nr:coproporphyrinogen dehydrogenase HemZ [Bacillota bacterium]
MYEIKLCSSVSVYEIEELVKMFVPKGNYEITVDEALDTSQSFSVVFEKEVISGSIEGFYYKGEKPADKKALRNAVKRGIFDALSRSLGKTLPWGILTGVKPVKIVRELYQKGIGCEEISSYMKEFYYLNDDKTRLLMNTLRNQYELSGEKIPGSAGVYLGIPFCPTRCVYCSFTANVAGRAEIERYLEALHKEIEYVSGRMKERGIKTESFYIGGGTPTALDSDQLDRLLGKIFESFDFSCCSEFTVEAGRPDTITEDKLKIIRKYGIGRISINPQSMNLKTLEAIGRLHSPEQIKEAFAMARNAGIEIINMDLIAGLPGENLDDFKRTLSLVTEMEPENITVHTLALKRASRLKEEDSDFNYREVEKLSQMVDFSRNLMESLGYRPYYLYRQKYMVGNLENIGYAKPGTECVYNIKTMDERQTMIALGAGGISKMYYPEENRIERAANVSNYEIYIDRIDEMLERKEQLIFANSI